MCAFFVSTDSTDFHFFFSWPSKAAASQPILSGTAAFHRAPLRCGSSLCQGRRPHQILRPIQHPWLRHATMGRATNRVLRLLASATPAVMSAFCPCSPTHGPFDTFRVRNFPGTCPNGLLQMRLLTLHNQFCSGNFVPPPPAYKWDHSPFRAVVPQGEF